jgi:primosomal protein N' (replication factor Y)
LVDLPRPRSFSIIHIDLHFLFPYFNIVMPSQKLPQFAEVVFPLPVRHAFTYQIPEVFRILLKPGHRVLAPFGRRRLTGYVVRLTDQTELTELKDIEDILDADPVLSPEMLSLTGWIGEYYFASWGEVLDAALPTGLNLQSHRQVRLADGQDKESVSNLEDKSEEQTKLLLLLVREGSLRVSQLERKLGSSNLNYNLRQLQRANLLSVGPELAKQKVKAKFANYVRLADSLKGNGDVQARIHELQQKFPGQAEILQNLASHAKGIRQTELLRRTKLSSSPIKSLLKKGFVCEYKGEVFRDEAIEYDSQPAEEFSLNEDQRAVLKKLTARIGIGGFAPVLLHGVTGSGKTQVYIEVLSEVRKRGKNAIVLVPEISLTPQTVGRFKGRFGEEVAVLHSRMSAGERYDSWRKMQMGRVNIAVGPRSAVLAPLGNIGLIVVDEEHESSYKQSEMNPRYHARDVALMRGKMNDAIVILGSATPATESYHNAKTRKYELLELPRRVEDLPLPRVDIIDMREEWKLDKSNPTGIFSKELIHRIAEKMALDEQVILLQNRRGFSTFILCHECGHVETCQNCNITLTYHLRRHLLRCHYCDFRKKAPEICPGCGGIRLGYRGVGTQRVEEELKRLLPQARVVRMDTDTTTSKGAHHRILRDFREGAYEILLGTQMVAKGLDFPRVTLVGVISADATLRLPDFRASERTFQLLTQVAGRSGRKGKQGEVIIQTYAPENHSIIFAQKHDYLRFYAKETNERAELNYPPFGRLIAVEFSGLQEEQVGAVASRFAASIRPASFFRLVGPAPAPLSKLKSLYRYHLILKYDRKKDPSGRQIRQRIEPVLERFSVRNRRSVRITIDVDPMDLF